MYVKGTENLKTILAFILLSAAICPAQVVPAITATCATSVDGSVVGVPNPLNPPVVNAGLFGTLPAGNYFVEIVWYDASSNLTLPSPEVQVQLTGTGELIISPTSSGMPANAVGTQVFIGTTSGSETFQGSVAGSATYYQNTPLTTGASPPTVNTTICKVIANDAGWPTGTGYAVSMTTPSGQTMPGYPVQMQFLGPGNTINLSQGLPYYNGTITYPIPILARPYGHGPQSISGPLSLGGYELTVGEINASGLVIFPDGGVLNGTFSGTPTFSGNVDFTGIPVFGTFNMTGNLLINGVAGTNGYCYGTNGTAIEYINCGANSVGGTPTLVLGAAAGSGGSETLESGSADQVGKFYITTGSGPTTGTLVTVTFGNAFSTYANCVISPYNTAAASVSPDILVVGGSTTQWDINVVTSALTASTPYIWNYLCRGH